MNPRDGSPIDRDYQYFLGTPVREWLDVKMLADEEGISIRGLVDQYRLLKAGERHRARTQDHLRLAIDRELINLATRETESLRHREALLEERVASLERRLAKLANV